MGRVAKNLKNIAEVASELGVHAESLTFYGKWKAKIDPRSLGGRIGDQPQGILVLVTAMTPTPLGEGKTVTAIGLAMGLHRLGKKSIVCLRQPSLGPTFGLKGGAAGGGKCTVEPMQDINLHFTGDIDAISSAHNLLAAMVDNHIFQGNQLGIDPGSITWPRVVDMNDRALRRITVGVGEAKEGVQHEGAFMITAASEVMAVHGLSRDYSDLKKRLGRIIIGYSKKGVPISAAQLKAEGAMAALVRDALEPNLVQTAEGTPALVHGGPFANIAHGTASMISIGLGLRLADYCVVEAGFASDLGMEKFVDIVTRAGGFEVNVVVVVASVKALRYHGGVPKDSLESPDSRAVMKGLENLAKHIENVRLCGLTPIVAINRFPTDSEEEIRQVIDFCREQGVSSAISTAFAVGGEGATELAERVVESARLGEKSHPLYPVEGSVEDKVATIVGKIYGGDGVDYEPSAKEGIATISKLGLTNLPVCIAKTPLSLSDDQTKTGRPRGFRVRVHKTKPAAGAGFNIVYMGDIVTMPGLPKVPLAEQIGLSDDGEISGLR